MSLKSIFGTWITLALRWRQDRKLRYFVSFFSSCFSIKHLNTHYIDFFFHSNRTYICKYFFFYTEHTFCILDWARKKKRSSAHHTVLLPKYPHLYLLLLGNHVINVIFGGWCFWLQKPVEDISCVSWNKQVQHILASASPGGKASVWDLRKNDLIIKVSDHSNRVCYFSSLWMTYVAIFHQPIFQSHLTSPFCSSVCRCTALDWRGTQKWRPS